VAAAAATVPATGDSAGSIESTTAVGGAGSAECSNSSATTVNSTGSSSSGSTMCAVQQSVSMKMIVTPEGWQSAIDNGVKLISSDGKRHSIYIHLLSIYTSYKVCIRDEAALS
jgi:hypothetical protein